MSKLLLVLAVLCFSSMAMADTTVINTVLFQGASSASCQGTNFTVTQNAGECKSQSIYYCSTAGDYVYQVYFSDASCNATYAQSILQIPTTCGGAGRAGIQFTCTNPAAGPALPAAWSFPPSTWTQFTTCFNSSVAPYTPACAAAGGDIKCYQGASAPQGCTKTKMANQPSSLSGCLSGGSDAATVFYSDDACAGSVVGAVVTPSGCNAGTTFSCSSANPISAASIPTIGYQTYASSSSCDATTGKPSTTYFFDNKCFSSQTYTCSNMVNGTTFPTLTTYANVNGSCTGAPVTTDSHEANKCFALSKDTSRSFICTSTPTPGAASTTGASMVAMIVAAIVALIASLSL